MSSGDETPTPSPSSAPGDLEAFRQAVHAPDERFSLFQTALLISAVEYPNQPAGWERPWHKRLNEIIHEARAYLGDPPPLTPRVAVKRLVTFFCEIQGFTGDKENYSAPGNSCLTDVLMRRRGLPITLAVLFVTMGRRLGLDVYGVGTPGHFLVGATVGPDDVVFVDPFHGTDLLSRDDAAMRIAQIVNLPAVSAEYIHPFLTREDERRVIYRMLNNLRASYRGANDGARLLRVTEWMLALDPNNMGEVRNRGLILLREGRREEGARDLLRYVASAPDDAEDLQIIRDEALKALGSQSLWN